MQCSARDSRRFPWSFPFPALLADRCVVTGCASTLMATLSAMISG